MYKAESEACGIQIIRIAKEGKGSCEEDQERATNLLGKKRAGCSSVTWDKGNFVSLGDCLKGRVKICTEEKEPEKRIKEEEMWNDF